MSISNSRRLLLPSATAAASPPELAQPRPGFGSFDMNVVMVLSVLLCALICSLGLNAILKCALRCSTLLATVSGGRGGGALVVHPKGVRRNILKKFPTVEYSKEGNKLRGIDGECVICLLEFEAGDRVRVLPKCYHGFHVHCIDKWLSSHTSCPKCRNCLTDTCPKITAGCGQEAPITTAALAESSSSVDPPAAEEVGVNVVIAPVEREGLISNYRESISR
ncbi:RING-H2 finger protein ATL78 [Benincasa hispida]|uniref:RING-H2 finger protein ATL78 n=1 Tax=Benincasa hispida TaxID=102211 RepID=UPI0019026622|nr:RING-H2 finger protein ATL78 [Benincasa hispida]